MSQLSSEFFAWIISYSFSAAAGGYLLCVCTPEVLKHFFFRPILIGIILSSLFCGVSGAIAKGLLLMAEELPDDFLEIIFSVFAVFGYYSLLAWMCCIANVTACNLKKSRIHYNLLKAIYVKFSIYFTAFATIALYFVVDEEDFLAAAQLGAGSLSLSNSATKMGLALKYAPASAISAYSIAIIYSSLDYDADSSSVDYNPNPKRSGFYRLFYQLVLLMLPLLINAAKILFHGEISPVLAFLECVSIPLLPLVLQYAIVLSYQDLDERRDSESGPLDVELLHRDQSTEERSYSSKQKKLEVISKKKPEKCILDEHADLPSQRQELARRKQSSLASEGGPECQRKSTSPKKMQDTREDTPRSKSSASKGSFEDHMLKRAVFLEDSPVEHKKEIFELIENIDSFENSLPRYCQNEIDQESKYNLHLNPNPSYLHQHQETDLQTIAERSSSSETESFYKKKEAPNEITQEWEKNIGGPIEKELQLFPPKGDRSAKAVERTVGIN